MAVSLDGDGGQGVAVGCSTLGSVGGSGGLQGSGNCYGTITLLAAASS